MVISRFLSIINVIIITRLLNPEDFGLYSVSMASITMILMFSVTGVDAAIIQKKETNEEDLNAAWTIEFIKHLLIGGLIYLGAPVAEKIVQIDGVGQILKVISIAVPLMGFKNIGILLFRKNLELKKLFWYNLVPQVMSMIFTIYLAFQLKNVWAIVYGYVFQTFLVFLFSYLIHPFRPRLFFNLNRYKELLNFGKWLLFNGLLQTGIKQGIVLMIGRSFGAVNLGYYNRSMAFSVNMFNPLQKLFAKLLFPAFSQLHNNGNTLKHEFCKSLKYTSFITGVIISTGFMFADEFVFYLLGNKWNTIIPILKILYINTFFQLIIFPYNMLFISIGKPEIRSYFTGANLIILLLLFIPFSNWWGLKGVVLLVLLSNFIIFLSISLKTGKYINIDFHHTFNSIKYGLLITFLIITESYLIMKIYPDPLIIIFLMKVTVLILTIFISLFIFEKNGSLQLNYLMNIILPKSRITKLYENLFCLSN